MMTCTAKDFVPYPGPKYEQAMTQSDDQRAFADQQRRQQLMPYKIEATSPPAVALVDREALAKWYFIDKGFDGLTAWDQMEYDHPDVKRSHEFVKRIIASGLIRPMPTEAQISWGLEFLAPEDRIEAVAVILKLLNGREG
jgi:hypothetical protein